MRRNSGYTLVEMVITVGITIFLATILFVYNSAGQIQVALFRDQSLVIGFLNRAKALALEKFIGSGGCAFGVHFAAGSRQFILFQDRSIGPACKEAGVYKGNQVYDGGEALETLEVDSRFKFTLPQGFPTLDILFIPPYLEVLPKTDSVITIGTFDNSRRAQVSVGPGGQISKL